MSAVRGQRFFRGNERVFGGATRAEADKRDIEAAGAENACALSGKASTLCAEHFTRILRAEKA